MMITLGIIAGSVRPNRFNIQPARWAYQESRKREGVSSALIDLEEINLPFLDEPVPPSQHNYSNEHTKRWSEMIGGTDAFVWVTPEYNHSTSPVLKNAIDYLYDEWNHKPVSIISYGSLAGGARAAEHLRGITGELKMYDMREQMLLPNYWDHLSEAGEFQFNERHEKNFATMLDELIFWAEVMKEARAKL